MSTVPIGTIVHEVLPDGKRPATVSTLRLRGQASHLTVQDIVTGRRHTLVLTGELDIASCPLLSDVLRHVIGDQSSSIVLDLRQLRFMDSNGVHAILEARALCAQRHCALTLVGGSPQVRRVLELTGVPDGQADIF